MTYKWVIVLVETTSREYDAKILFSLYLAKRGFNVIIGEKALLLQNINLLPKAIIIEKNITQSDFSIFLRYIKLGMKIVAWDEEGILEFDGKYVDSRIGESSLGAIEKFFTWGKVQRDKITNAYPNFGNRVYPLGNPRLDLYTEKFNNKIILINTRFGVVNSNKLESPISNFEVDIKNKEDLDFYSEYINFDEKIFEKFIEAIKKIASLFTNYQIIVRPHPSESQEIYKKLDNLYPNVRTIFEGSVIPWIMSSNVMIHNSCTTGIEAYLLKSNSISYMPIKDKRFDLDTANQFSEIASTEEDLILLVDRILKNNFKVKDESLIQRKIALSNLFFSDAEKFSSEAIADEIEKIKIDLVSFPIRKRLRFNSSIYLSSLKGLLKSVFGKSHLQMLRYRAQKYQQPSKREVSKKITRFAKIDYKFASVKTFKIARGVFIVKDKESKI